jgi:ribosomal protein L11 methyltransferase
MVPALSADRDRAAVSWKASLPCTRAEAEALRDDLPAMTLFSAPPTLMSSEPDPRQSDRWRLDAYFESPPTEADLALLRMFVPSASETASVIEPLADEDWVSLSQRSLEPISAGRFFVHTAARRGAVPRGTIAFEIDAGRAFGTGHHETTSGCLLALDRLKRSGLGFSNILDLGTGTGLLAFAALRLWPLARVAASDVDPVAIEVSDANAALNRIPRGRRRGRLETIVAAGLDHPRLEARAPYDLIVANILAGPLIALARPVAEALRPGGQLVLAGLLRRQAEAVLAAYRRQRVSERSRIGRGDWTILVLRKRRRFGRHA